MHGSQVCQYDIPGSYVIVANNRPIAVESTTSHTCVPDRGYCHYREYGSSSKNLFCLRKFIRGILNADLIKVCSFSCRPSLGEDDVHVTSLGNHHFALVAAPPTTSIECTHTDGNLTQEFVSPEHNLGGHIVTLPCQCRIVIPGHTVVTNPLPCRKSGAFLPVVNRVIPSLWAQVPVDKVIKAMRVQPTLFDKWLYENMTTIYNPDWAAEELIIANYSETPLDLFAEEMNDNHHIYEDFLNFSWKVCITFAVLWLVAKQYPFTLPWFVATQYAPVTKALPVIGRDLPTPCQLGHQVSHKITIIGSITGFLVLVILLACAWRGLHYCREAMANRAVHTEAVMEMTQRKTRETQRKRRAELSTALVRRETSPT